jgi:hypothetical protein
MGVHYGSHVAQSDECLSVDGNDMVLQLQTGGQLQFGVRHDGRPGVAQKHREKRVRTPDKPNYISRVGDLADACQYTQ